jgi:hypothetical protein
MGTIKFHSGERGASFGNGPRLAFAASILAGLAAWVALITTTSAHFAVPAVATLLFVLAAALALLAWCHDGEDPVRVTYTDVAGALTLIGLCVAATIEPEQLVRLVESDSTQP